MSTSGDRPIGEVELLSSAAQRKAVLALLDDLDLRHHFLIPARVELERGQHRKAVLDRRGDAGLRGFVQGASWRPPYRSTLRAPGTGRDPGRAATRPRLTTNLAESPKRKW